MPFPFRRRAAWSFPVVLLAGALSLDGVGCGARTTLGQPTGQNPGAGGSTSSSSRSSSSSSVSSSSGFGGFGGTFDTTSTFTETGGTFSTGFPTSSSSSSMVVSSSSSSGVGGGIVMNPVISISPDTVIESETWVAASPDGTVVVAWIGVPQTNAPSFIGYAVSFDDGATFSPPEKLLSPAGREASDPVVALDASGNFYVSWVGYYIQGQNPVDMHVYVTKGAKFSGGFTFGNVVEASNPAITTDFYDKPWIAITAAGSLLVTYSDQTATSYDLDVARSTDGGQTWTQAKLASDPSLQTFRNLAYPCPPATHGRIYATYLNFPTASNLLSVGISWSDDDGATWVDPSLTPIVSGPNDQVAFDDPTCATDGQSGVWVAYGLTHDMLGQFESDKSYSIELAHSGDQAQTFTSEPVGDPSSPFFIHPQMIREPGGALDFTTYGGAHNNDMNGRFIWSRALDPSSPPGPAEDVEIPVIFTQQRSSARWLGDYTGLFTQSGKLYMSYAVNTTGAAHIAFAKRALP